MRKKPPASSGESAPLWVVSFADLVSLLMAFFVMLASFSAGSKEDVKFRQLLRSLQEAFGYASNTEGVALSDPAEVLARLERLKMKNFKPNNAGEKTPGRENTVKRTREGIEFTIGGQIGFAPGSAELRNEAKTALNEISQYVRGENNKIEIRGHSTQFEAGAGKQFDDQYKLAYARACSVADYMVGQGVRGERLRRVDCGSSEPLVVQAYDDQAKAANRRVEIIVTQALVQQFEGGGGEPPPPAPPSPPPGQAEQSQPPRPESPAPVAVAG